MLFKILLDSQEIKKKFFNGKPKGSVAPVQILVSDLLSEDYKTLANLTIYKIPINI